MIKTTHLSLLALTGLLSGNLNAATVHYMDSNENHASGWGYEKTVLSDNGMNTEGEQMNPINFMMVGSFSGLMAMSFQFLNDSMFMMTNNGSSWSGLSRDGDGQNADFVWSSEDGRDRPNIFSFAFFGSDPEQFKGSFMAMFFNGDTVASVGFGDLFDNPGVGNDDAEAPIATPIPATAWLLGSGLIGMTGIARRRHSRTRSLAAV